MNSVHVHRVSLMRVLGARCVSFRPCVSTAVMRAVGSMCRSGGQISLGGGMSGGIDDYNEYDKFEHAFRFIN